MTLSKKKLFLATILIANSANATEINFNSFALVDDVAGTDVGDVYRFEDITVLPNGSTVDALMTITSSTLSDLGFNGVESISGDDVRWRLNNEIGHTTIRVDFVQDNLNTLVSSPLTDLTVLFDDIDSDTGRNGSDFAGLKTTDFTSAFLNDVTTLTIDDSLVSGYSVAHLSGDGLGDDPTDFTEWGNNTSNDGAGQSPSTAAFQIDSTNSFEFIVGQLGPTAGFRHIDLDITPDFTLTNPVNVTVPEPGSVGFLCVSLGMLFGLRRRG